MLAPEMPHFHAFGCRHPGGMKADTMNCPVNEVVHGEDLAWAGVSSSLRGGCRRSWMSHKLAPKSSSWFLNQSTRS